MPIHRTVNIVRPGFEINAEIRRIAARRIRCEFLGDADSLDREVVVPLSLIRDVKVLRPAGNVSGINLVFGELNY